MIRSRLILIPLFQQLRLVTDGQANTFVHTDLDAPEFRHLLPHADTVTLFFNTEARSSPEFAWTVHFASGYSRSTQGNLIPLGAEITSLGSGRMDYATIPNFNLDSRLVVSCKNKSGSTSSAFEWGVVSATLGVRTFGI